MTDQAKVSLASHTLRREERSGHAAQGVVTYMSPVEVFVTAIKFFDWQKVCLIA